MTSYGPAPVPQASIVHRRIASLILLALLYTAANPFTPFYWILNIEGAFLFDRFFSGAALLSACYFQWQIAGRTHPIAIVIPLGAGNNSGSTIRGGRMGKSENEEFMFLYQPRHYWMYAVAEAAMLALAHWSGFEILRRGLVVMVVAALWSVGWFVTPEWVKERAWGYLKSMWYWIALQEIMNYGHNSGMRARRR